MTKMAEEETLESSQTSSLPPLVRAMMRADFYAHQPPSVQLRQTHVSYLLLAGEYVYKLRKPVRLPFLDCSTVGKRRYLCQEEVRLNSRLSPEIYLGVVAIVHTGGGYVLAENGAEGALVEDFAVKMRRLPDELMLEPMVRAGLARAETIAVIARKLAAFHSTAATAKSWIYGCSEAVWRMVIDNLREIEAMLADTVTEGHLKQIEDFSRDYMASHHETFDRRARERRVCEGHGDLRCDSICLAPQGIVIFDCLEFSERLRYGDVASDMAFLAMDLDRLEREDLSAELVSTYCDAASDPELAVLLPFYKCYRATVRGKVEMIRSLEQEVSLQERLQARDMARHYFELARRYAEQAAAPAIVVVCGPAATGKSTLAHLLGGRLGFEVLSSDLVRKRLAGIAATSRVLSEYGEGIYSEGFSLRVYGRMLKEAEERVITGRGVILDGTFRYAQQRRLVMELAARAGVPALFIECRAPKEEVLRRLARRTSEAGVVSDATAQVYLHQLEEFEPLAELPESRRLVADTTADLQPLLSEVERRLQRAGLRAPAEHPSPIHGH